MLTPTNLIIPFDWYEREQFICSYRGRYPARIIELVTGKKIRMAAKRIPRAPKADSRHNGTLRKAPASKPQTISITVAPGTVVLTTPDKAEMVRNKYRYLTEFKA